MTDCVDLLRQALEEKPENEYIRERVLLKNNAIHNICITELQDILVDMGEIEHASTRSMKVKARFLLDRLPKDFKYRKLLTNFTDGFAMALRVNVYRAACIELGIDQVDFLES